jgi:CitB family two-component system sensor histidine kinase MalK
MRIKRIDDLNLITRITILVCGVIIVSLLITGFLISQFIEQRTISGIEERARNVSQMVALSELTMSQLEAGNPDGEIQPYAERIRDITGVAFVVVLDMNSVRHSHPIEELIGQTFVGGDEGPVFEGLEHISTAEGTMGYSLRSFTPVINDQEEQVGAVVVGILLDDVKKEVWGSHFIILFGMVIGIIAGIIGAYLMGRKVKKIMFGLEPAHIAKIFEERNAILQSTKEGIIAIDKNETISLVNYEAIRLFKKAGYADEPVGQLIQNYLPDTRLHEVVRSGKRELDQEFELNGLILVVNRVPIIVEGDMVGAVATFRDKTEVKKMAEELTGVRTYAEALRAQTHEFMNKLHVILGMVSLERYEELRQFVKETTRQSQSEVGNVSTMIKDPVLAGVIFGKMSYARENGIKLELADTSHLPVSNKIDTTHQLVSILGNLLDNAIHATNTKKKPIELEIYYEDGTLEMIVTDYGTGMTKEQLIRATEKGFSTKGKQRGMGLYLVERTVKELDGKLKLHSEWGNGTSVYVKVPYQPRGETE